MKCIFRSLAFTRSVRQYRHPTTRIGHMRVVGCRYCLTERGVVKIIISYHVVTQNDTFRTKSEFSELVLDTVFYRN